jgi:transketolase
MKFELAEQITMAPVEMRKVYTDTLIELAMENPNVVVLDCDLMRAMGTFSFKETYPDRTIDCGIMEATMYSVCAGLSTMGKIPFAHTFGVFSTRRACDQIFVSCAYAKHNVKVVGSDPGVTAAINGGTHMSFEDVGIMRSIPGVTVIEPTDNAMMRDMVFQLGGIYGVQYIRLVRKSVPDIYKNGSTFTIGKANHLREGSDVAVFVAGILVAEALKAAEHLAAGGISVDINDMFTIKPIDREAILAAAIKCGAVVTAENHSVFNGLGSAVAEVLSEEHPTPCIRVGINDEFGEVGPREYLQERFGLTAAKICEAVRKAIAMKPVQRQL